MLTDNKKMTMREIFRATEFAQVRAHLPGGVTMFIEGKIKLVEDGETYWIGQCSFSAETELTWNEIFGMWIIYVKGEQI